MYYRRDILKFGLQAGALMTVAAPNPVQAQIQPSGAPPAPKPGFDANYVLGLARNLAKSRFAAPNTALPAPFSSLSYEQYSEIVPQDGSAIWSSAGLGFIIEPLHRGFIFTTPMEISIVEDGNIQPVTYDRARFDFGKVRVPPDIKDIGYSGFRILESREGGFDERAIFQGASFFRALAKDQTLGVTARALAIRTADPRGEEFPIIRAVWIEKPDAGARTLTIHALLDSESVTGAYRFTLRSNDATIIDTEVTLFPRVDIDHVGIAAMQATSLYTPLDRHSADDVRPGVFEVAGLRMLTGHDEWLWRPVSNRLNLQGSAFADQNPHGFGLLQRERNPDNFIDDDQHWERRPSLWIEPIADWGEGRFELIEIPSEAEVNQNINAYWRPKEGLKAGKEATYSYRQFWCWSPPTKPALATATASRSGKIIVADKYRRRFVVDFTGDNIAALANPAAIKADTSVTGGTLTDTKIFVGKNNKTLRVQFDIEPTADNLTEIRLLLQAEGKPLSETWLYRWTI